jgi:hypothetical protein
MTENFREVEVNGKKYKIRKWVLGDRKVLMKYMSKDLSQIDPEKIVEMEAELIMLSVIEPKFEKMDDVLALSQEEADELFFQIMTFNKPKKNFLEELKNTF